MHIAERLWKQIQDILPGIHEKPTGTALKLKADGFMDLVVEVLGREPFQNFTGVRVSLSHYGEQNGDLMADPDVEALLVPEMGRAYALTFRNDYLGIARRYVVHDCADNSEFLSMWLGNVKAQGHKLPEGETA